MNNLLAIKLILLYLWRAYKLYQLLWELFLSYVLKELKTSILSESALPILTI